VESRAQVSIEYILLLVGALLLAILLYILFQNRIFNPAEGTITNQISVYRNITNVS